VAISVVIVVIISIILIIIIGHMAAIAARALLIFHCQWLGN
jgi:tryptophan-rich sensory protein